MTVGEKRDFIAKHCEWEDCKACVLRDKEWKDKFLLNNCLNIAIASEEELDRAIKLITGSSPENGGNNVDKASVTISLERYDELIKKEVLYDELTRDKKISTYLYQDVNEQLREDK